jgi:carbon-monoxide dehydrogenase medium subunit
LLEAECLLNRQMPSKAAFSRAADAAALAIDPMEDINNTAGYRRKLVHTLLQRALETAA